MARIILPQRWTRQPQMAMRVNRSHPLARDLIEFGYVLGGKNPISAMPGLAYAPFLAGTTESVATPHGLGINTDGTGNYINLGRNLSASSAVATSIVRTTLPDPLVSTQLFNSALQSGANYVGHFFNIGSTGLVAANYGDGGGAGGPDRRSADSAAGVAVPGPNTLAFVCRGATDWSIYANGIDTGTPTYSGTGGAYSAGTANGTVNFRAAGTFYGSQSASSWAFFNRALTDAEIFALNQAPFQILEPIRRRVFVAVSAGVGDIAGSSTGTLSLSGSMLASGALAGSSALAFSGIAPLSASGTLSGASTATFSPAASAMGAAALSGAAAASFSAAGLIDGAGALLGSSAVSFAPAATLTGDAPGALAGASTIALTLSSAMGGSGALLGAAAVAFTPSGAMLGAADLQGISTVAFTPQGVLLADGALAGASVLSLLGQASMAGAGILFGSSAIAFLGAGSLTDASSAGLSGVSSFSFSLSGGLSKPNVSGSAVLLTITASAVRSAACGSATLSTQKATAT